MDEIIGYRTSLVRGKKRFSVKTAREPDKMLELTQELVMSSKPVDTEMSFIKRPKLDIDFSPRIAPSGPSGDIKKARLTENPKIPRIVDKIVTHHSFTLCRFVWSEKESSISSYYLVDHSS